MSNETKQLRATAHPLRLRILSLLTGTELSAAEVARELDLTHANASYHLRQLLDAGQVVVSSEERIRGGVAKRYRHPWEQSTEHPSDGWDHGHRVQWANAMSSELTRRVQHATPRAGHFTDAELWVEEADLGRVKELLEEASTLLHASAKPPRTAGTTKVALTAALFEMDPT